MMGGQGVMLYWFVVVSIDFYWLAREKASTIVTLPRAYSPTIVIARTLWLYVTDTWSDPDSSNHH